jgi:hypothetical protein
MVFDSVVGLTAAITCGVHIDEARDAVEHLQTQRADWCIAMFCGHYNTPLAAFDPRLGLARAEASHQATLAGLACVQQRSPTTPGVQGP